MIRDIKELNFPSYATLSSATCEMPDMGERSITAQVKINGFITPDFSFDWEVEFRGERYIMPLREPQGAKENTSLDSVIDLTFQHWAIYRLKNRYFVTLQPIESGTAVPDKFVAPVKLNLVDFCDLFGQVLQYYFGDEITMDLNPDWDADPEPQTVEISYSYLWDVLLKFNEIWGVRWEIAPNGGNDRYVIKVGYPTEEIDHIFEYGFKGGLLKVERQVQNENIHNVIYGRGGTKNLPAYYFKQSPDETVWQSDPDWIPELKNIPFDRLRDKSFRDYVKGWKTNPHRDTLDGSLAVDTYLTALGAVNYAYRRGHEDEKFDPVEFVRCDGYQFEDGTYHEDKDSIGKYGELPWALADNEDVYPTIQGVDSADHIAFFRGDIGRIDEVVAVEQIESDDIEDAATSLAKVADAGGCQGTREVGRGSIADIVADGGTFTVDEGTTADVELVDTFISGLYYATGSGNSWGDRDVPEGKYELLSTSIQIIRVAGGAVLSPNGIPPGVYRYKAVFQVQNKFGQTVKITAGCRGAKVVMSNAAPVWTNTFDIWIKNIWGTHKQTDETAEQYVDRVWRKILGDKEGGEAKVVFSDGDLSVSEDYEFVIVDGGVSYDPSKTLDGVTSHWRLTLAKSDADMKSLGVYVPSTMRQGKAGDHFFFTGIELPHQYVLWGEEELHNKKIDAGDETGNIKPDWIVSLDKVRISEKNLPDAGSVEFLALEDLGVVKMEQGGGILIETSGMTSLLEKIREGMSFRLADKRFIPAMSGDATAYETLYISQVRYTYNEPTSEDAALIPDVEITLSEKYETVANPVAQMQGDIESLSRRIGSISNLEALVRAVGDKLYLRKDGISDRSVSPTEFGSLLTSLGFRNGIIGGKGWGFFKDENGRWVLEVDSVNVRTDLQVNNLVVNQVTARGGMIIESAASMELTAVYETSSGYECHFDQKQGTVANLFKVGDVAMSMVYNDKWQTDSTLVKYYRRRVVAVSAGSVTLSKNIADGSGVPMAGDVIVQYGSYTDPSRRYVIIRDVVNGGYERFIEGLDSVNSEGREYFFVGRQAGMYNNRPRWYIGDEQGYIEWIDGALNIKGKINTLSTIDNKPIGEWVDDRAKNVVADTDRDSQNLLRNSDFTQGLSFWVPNSSASLDKELRHNSHPTVKIEMSGFTTNQWQGILQTTAQNDRLTVKGGEWFTASISAYADDLGEFDAGAALEVQFYDADGTGLGSKSVQIVPSHIGKWERFSVTSQAPASAVSVRVFAYVTRNGVLNVSEIKFENGQSATRWEPSPFDTDYLTKALLEEGEQSGGLILSSHIRLGQKGESGTREVTAGLNGIVTDGKDLALWCGGEMIDPELDAANGATSGIRHDGTAFFARNTVRFKENRAEVGNDVVLDKNGLTLSSDDGSATLQIANISVGTNIGNSETYQLTGSTTGQLLVHRYKITYNYFKPGSGGTEVVTSTYYECHADELLETMPAVINSEPLQKGDYIQSSVAIAVQTSNNMPLRSGVSVILAYKNNSGTLVDFASEPAVFTLEGSTNKATASIKANIPVSTDECYLRVVVKRTRPSYNTASWNWEVESYGTPAYSTLSAALSGKADRAIADRTITGNDGFISVWGSSGILVNEEGVTLKSGFYMVRLSSRGGGLKYSNNEGSSWKEFTFN